MTHNDDGDDDKFHEWIRTLEEDVIQEGCGRMSDIVKRLRERAAVLLDPRDRVISDATIAADEIVRLRAAIRCERETGTCVMVHEPERAPCNHTNCRMLAAIEQAAERTDG